MDLFTRLLVRAAMWVRRPPSRAQLVAVFVAIAVSLLIVGIEHFVGWPDWLTANPLPRRPGLMAR